MFEGTDWQGNYGRFIFDDSKKYMMLLREMGVPIQAEEMNVMQEIQMTFLRKIIKTMIGDGAFSDGFKIVGTGVANDFSITAGELLLEGWMPELAADVLYSAQPYSQSALTTPSGADRTDEVYLDVYHEEIDNTEDSEILNPAIGVRTYCMWQLRWAVKAAEGGSVPADGVDGNNIYHWRYKLATLNRVDGNALITSAMVVDARGHASSELINLGSDANGDIYYREAGRLKRLPKSTNSTVLILENGVPKWSNLLAYMALDYWFEKSNPKDFSLMEIIWVETLSLFVAVGGNDGVDAYIVTSPDGRTWTERDNPKNEVLRGIAWSEALGLLCAVGFSDPTDAYIITSPDGITWTERDNPKVASLYYIAWSDTLNLFAAVGASDGGDAYIVTSPDGTVWTERSNPKAFALDVVKWNGSIFCACGSGDGTDAYIVTSLNGTTWTERTNPKNVLLRGLAWSDKLSLFVAVGSSDGADAYIITSPDGITWTERDNPKDGSLQAVIWSSDFELFISVGSADGTDAYMITSADGIAWMERNNPKNIGLQSIAQGVNSMVAVGDADGTDAYMITSFS